MAREPRDHIEDVIKKSLEIGKTDSSGVFHVCPVKNSWIFDILRRVMRQLMVAAKTLSYYEPEHVAKWLKVEARALLLLPRQLAPPSDCASTTGTASAAPPTATYGKRRRRERGDADELQDQVHALIQDAVSKLKIQDKAEAEHEAERLEKAVLGSLVTDLQAETDRLRQAWAADQDKFKAEMEVLHQKRDEDMLEQKKSHDKEKALIRVEAIEEARTCKICLAEPHNVVLLPCSHACYCEECVEKVRKTSKKCPACRAVITGTMRYIF